MHFRAGTCTSWTGGWWHTKPAESNHTQWLSPASPGFVRTVSPDAGLWCFSIGTNPSSQGCNYSAENIKRDSQILADIICEINEQTWFPPWCLSGYSKPLAPVQEAHSSHGGVRDGNTNRRSCLYKRQRVQRQDWQWDTLLTAALKHLETGGWRMNTTKGFHLCLGGVSAEEISL